MWWPGGKDPDPALDPGGDTGSDPEVMEILSEEDVQSGLSSSPPLEAYGEPSGIAPLPSDDLELSDEDDLKDLKNQFLEQENLLGQLKGVLKSNEEKLHNKEREVLDYATRLQKIRDRPLYSTSSPIGVKGAESVKLPEAGGASGTATGTGKIRLLRKQLEEAR